MKLLHMHYFVTVVNCGSISKAAEKLYLDRGNLSAIISSIEEKCTVPLLVRMKKGVHLTKQGKEFYQFCEDTLFAAQKMMNAFTSYAQPKEQNDLIISIPYGVNTLSFFDVLDSFIDNYPNIILSIQEFAADRESDYIQSKTNTPFVEFFHTIEGKTEINNPQRISVEIETVKLYAYCSSKCVIAKYDSISLKTLENMPILLYSSSISQSALPNFKCYSLSFVSNFSIFKKMLSTGKYVTFGSNLENAIDMREFIRINITDAPKFTLNLAIDKKHLHNDTVKLFLQFYFDYMNYPFPSIFK